MRRFILFFALLTYSWAASAQEVDYTKADSMLVMQLLKKGKQQKAGTNIFLFFARQFLGSPYAAHTLDKNKEERLVINLRELDCTTYVEYVLALSQCVKHQKYTFKDFCRYLKEIRYIGGNVSYTSRQHYFTIWINDNMKDGFVKDIQSPNPPFTAVQTVNVDYMTKHIPSYYMLNLHPEWVDGIRNMEQSINGKRYRYIPKNKILNTKLMRQTIKNGDILVILTRRKGLDTSHIGIASWHKDGLHLINASMIHKKVVEDPMTLYRYMQKHSTHTGIRVVRPL